MRPTSRCLLAVLALAAVVGLAGCIGNAQAADSARVAEGSAPTPSATSTPPPPIVVTIGDSIMSGHGLDAAQAWPVLVSQERGVTITNLGCSGAGFTTPGSCGKDFAGLIPQAVAAAPTLVIIQSSDNDENATSSDIDDHTAQTVAAIHAALPHARIVGLSTLWNQPSAPPATIASSSQSLQHAVQEVGGVFVDIGQPLQGVGGMLQDDQEHPTTDGQQTLASVIVSALHKAGIAL